MALNIKDPETELFVRILARRRGVSLTEAVRQAVNSELDSDALPEPEKARRIVGRERWLDNFYKKYTSEKPIRAMTKQELNAIVDDHYKGAPSKPTAASAKLPRRSPEHGRLRRLCVSEGAQLFETDFFADRRRAGLHSRAKKN